jgi:hypothetical protein
MFFNENECTFMFGTLCIIRQPLTREVLDAWQRLIATSIQLEREIEAGRRVMLARVFHAMFLYMGLQLLTDPKLAQDALEVCYNTNCQC